MNCWIPPGINAPVEHEKISRESLDECQVILFVISSGGSHDDAKVYTAMKEVVDMDKKLFIVLNDKEGYGINSPAIRDIADSIQKNLEKIGLDRQQAASFSFNIINAQYALDGRINDDSVLVENSGISELEQRMLQEIKRVKGFDIMADLCSYIIDKFTPFAETLAGLGSVSDNGKMENYYSMLEDNGKLCSLLENKIDDRCASLPNLLRNCFGHPAVHKPEVEVQDAIQKTYEKYNRDLIDTYKQDMEIYLAGMAKRINMLIDINTIKAPYTNVNIDEGRYGYINERHNKAMSDDKPLFSEQSSIESGPNIWDILINSGPILDRIPLPKLPIPIPTGPVIIIVKKIYDLFFGESEEDKKNRQMEQAIRAEKEAAERQAREMARYEEELKQYCDDMAMEFRNEAKRNFRQNLSSLMEPIFQQIRDEFKKQSQIREQVLSDVNKVGHVMSSFEIIRSDLRTSAI